MSVAWLKTRLQSRMVSMEKSLLSRHNTVFCNVNCPFAVALKVWHCEASMHVQCGSIAHFTIKLEILMGRCWVMQVQGDL